MKKTSIVTILFLVFVSYNYISALDITASGFWNETINEADLVSGAGSILIDTYISPANASSITVTNCTDKKDKWRVDIKRTDSFWNAAFILSAKRTTRGSGLGAVNGGINFMEITTVDQEFISGKGDRLDMNIQYQLTGMSINIPPNNYSTVVTFTIVDT